MIKLLHLDVIHRNSFLNIQLMGTGWKKENIPRENISLECIMQYVFVSQIETFS